MQLPVIRLPDFSAPFALVPTGLSSSATGIPEPATPSASKTGQKVLPPGAQAACQVIWEVYKGDGLTNKNRAMVWNEVVSQQVAGSKMDARQFYQLVVEHNPVLKTDGYVFQRGKTYRLPRCP